MSGLTGSVTLLTSYMPHMCDCATGGGHSFYFHLTKYGNRCTILTGGRPG